MAHIKTYCRIKPSKTTFTDYQIAPNTLHIQVPENLRETSSDVNSRQRSTVNHDFKFTFVFSEDASQEEVFNKVAKDIVEGFLAGYNGTIFAYGQTGTGKTYTVEGSARRYKDRGLAPRAISMIYNSLQSRQGEEIDVHVSYMEIYQEVGYDLLNPAARLSSIVTSFPKVSVVEGPQGSCVIRNLSQHLAASEDVAQSLLLEGQANRQVAETSMNQRSSRSHAVFTIQLSVKKPADDIIIRSKLHLVDLAGSERVSKTKIEGQQLTEAKYINLSLHHLEGVIIALQQKSTNVKHQLPTPNFTLYNRVEFKARLSKENYARWVNSLRPSSASTTANPLGHAGVQQTKHIPYRNSLLTMVLRDSLGGNCQTAMIATITFEEENLGETISTCRFAQRVACVTNVVSKNEELDDKSLIRRLRRRVAELESEVAMLREGLELPAQPDGSRFKLSDDEKLECARIMQNYLTGRTSDPITAGITTPARFRESLRLLKKLILEHYVREDNHTKVVLDARTQKAITNTQPSKRIQLPPVSSASSASSHSPHNLHSITSTKQNVSEWLDASKKAVKDDEKLSNSDSSRDQPQISATPRPARSRSSVRSMRPSETKPEPAPRTPSRQYKSPFELQREKEVKRLDQKVTQEEEKLQKERSQLDKQQSEIKVAQLQLLNNELSSKLSSTQKQLSEQKLHILQLQNNKADPELIQQEKTVARQLRKREMRVEHRLRLVSDQLEKLQDELSNNVKPVPKPRPSKPRTSFSSNQQNSTESEHSDSAIRSVPQRRLVDRASNEHGQSGQQNGVNGHSHPAASGQTERFPQYVKRDSHVNSRQVLEALKAQEKKQEKLQHELEQEKILTRSKEIELKEAATRQRLLEFKEKLRQAKLGTFQARKTDSSSDYSGSGTDLSKPEIPSRRSAFIETRPPPTRSKITAIEVPSNIVEVEKTDSTEEGIPATSTGSLFDLSTNHSRTGPGMPANQRRPSHYDSTSSTRSLAGSASPPPSVWNEDQGQRDRFQSSQTLSFITASRAPSVSSRNVHDLNRDLSYLEKKRNVSEMWGTESIAHNSAVNTPMIPQFVGGDISRPSTNHVASVPIPDHGYEDTPRVPSALHRSASEHSFDIGRSNSETDICDAEVRRVFQEDNDKEESGSDDDKPQCADGSCQDLTKTQTKTKFTLHQPEVLVNQFLNHNAESRTITSKQTFSHQKFDETLQKMLGTDTQPTLTYEHEHYDKFARPDRSIRSRSKTAKASNRTDLSTTVTKTTDSIKSKPFNPWGPEAKGMTVGERIARYLKEASKSQDLSRSDGNSESDSFIPPPQAVDFSDQNSPGRDRPNSNHLTKTNPSKVKVKALEEKEREAAYMSSVRAERLRVARIRKARTAAEVIQRAWRCYKNKRR